MGRSAKELLQAMVGGRKLHRTKRTRPEDLQALLDRLRPVSCGKELIRLGPAGDGGYLVPDDLAGIEACFSPGVDETAGFELACARRGMPVFLADASVKESPETHELFRFTPKFIGATENDVYITLDGWVASALPGCTGDLLLQIDIEGYEYEAFLNASDALMKRFRVMVVEFHYLDQLWSKHYFRMVSRVFDKLLQTHRCVHNHPNNQGGYVKRRGIALPRLSELTFLRHDRVENPVAVTAFPHPLDRDNTDRPPVVLPSSWHA